MKNLIKKYIIYCVQIEKNLDDPKNQRGSERNQNSKDIE